MLTIVRIGLWCMYIVSEWSYAAYSINIWQRQGVH